MALNIGQELDLDSEIGSSCGKTAMEMPFPGSVLKEKRARCFGILQS